ncbi:hypothetical protein BSKO_11768 [Bryopsis sp. KO-2023]|nr:hypothetical protein BSKO_11768 [Bryopsis sp. KO-2023]
MKDADIQRLTTLASVLLEAEWGSAVERAVEEIVECLNKTNGPVVGRQTRKYRACISQLCSGMEEKFSSAKEGKREKDAEVVLIGLWDVESMQYRSSGTSHDEKVALRLYHRKFRILWRLNNLSDAKGVTERAWDLFNQLVAALNGVDSRPWLSKPVSDTVEEPTVELVFGVVTVLINSLAKTKQVGKILALRSSIEGLRHWAALLDDEKSNDLMSRVESQLASALTGWAKDDECCLTEGDLAALVTLHLRVCNRVTRNGLRHVTIVIQRIPFKWLGRIGGHILLNIEECDQPVVQKVLESLSWQILRKSVEQKCNTPAMDFMKRLKGCNWSVPEESSFHVGAVEIMGLPNTAQFNLDWGRACRNAVARLKKMMNREGSFEDQEAVSDVIRGLECLGMAAEFILQNSSWLDLLKKLDSYGKSLIKTMCDGLQTIWQLLEMKTVEGPVDELLNTHKVRLVRALVGCYRIEARFSKDCPKSACSMGEFRRLLQILTRGPDISSDFPNLGWRIVQLGKDLNDENRHREAAHAFLGAGLVLSKSLSRTSKESTASKNILYCCWHAKDKLVCYGGLDPDAELHCLGEMVLDLIHNSGYSPADYGSIVGYYAELMVSCSNLVSVQTLTDQALERSTWKDHLREICRIAWLEIDALGRIRAEHCVFVRKALARAVKLLKSDLGSSQFLAHLARVQILEAVAARLTQPMSKSEDCVDDVLKKVSEQIGDLAGQDRSDSMEALGCGYLAFGLIEACHAGNEKSDTEMARLWWNRSLSRLRQGAHAILMLLSNLSPADKLFDPIFAGETLTHALWLADARGFVMLASEFRSILSKLIDSGRFEYLNERVEKNLTHIADCHWLGHTEGLLDIKTLGKDGKPGSLCAILGDIRRGADKDSGVDGWLGAYCDMGAELEKYNDAGGFQARLYLCMVACRSDFTKGRCIKALDRIGGAISKCNGYHGQSFPQNEVSIGLTTVPWWIKGDFVSTFVMKAEILEVMGRPKEAQNWLDNGLDVAQSVHAHSYIALVNLMKAGMDVRLGMFDQARGALEKSKGAVEAGKQGSEEKDWMFGYLEALLLKTEGDLAQASGTNTRSSSAEASCLYKASLEILNGVDLGGCMRWPSQALRLKIETSLADCQVSIDHTEPALSVLISSFDHLGARESIMDYLGTDTLVAIYQGCRICRKGSEGAFSNLDDSGHFFGLRSTRDRFWRVVLDSDDEMDAEPTTSISHDWMLAQAQKIVTAGRLHSALDWIEILVYCWNHFQEIPDRMKEVSLDLSAEFAQGGQMNAAVFFLFWALGSAFRLQCLTNLKSVRLNSEDLQSLLTPPTFSLRFGGLNRSDLVAVDEQCSEHLENLMSHLPPNTCSLAITRHPWTKNVLVGRYSIGKSPILVMLPAVCQTLENPVESERLNLLSSVERFNSLLKGQETTFDGDASEVMNRSAQKEWWASRFRSEKSMKELVMDIDKNCLGEWSWLLSGEMENQQIQDLGAEAAREFTEEFVRSVPGSKETAVLTELIRLAFMAGDHVSLDELTRGVEMLCEIVGCPSDSMVATKVSQARKMIWGLNGLPNDPSISLTSVAEETCMLVPDTDPPPTATRRRQSRISLMQATKTPVRPANKISKLPASVGRPVQTPKPIKPISEEANQAAMGKESRMASMLTLDPSIQTLPWENCPSLANWTFYRAPSLVVACALGMELNKQDLGDDVEMGPMRNIDLQSTFYVLDPDGDLPTLGTFKDQFSEIPNWRGVTGARPCWDELSRELEARDMYIYFGHGLGERFINSNELKKLSCRSAALIMGCNSGTLWDQGRYEPNGRILNFLLGGCPAVIGNLWTVTDRSINQFSQGVLNSWKKSRSGEDVDSVCLATSLSAGRESCDLRYLTGAAAVCYGVPVRIKRFKDREA